MKEAHVERHLVRRVKELGGEVRKVTWVGRQGAPDRLVMLPAAWFKKLEAPFGLLGNFPPQTVWVELKNPETIRTFPSNAHERAQKREHERMRALGQRVEVIGTIEQVEELLA